MKKKPPNRRREDSLKKLAEFTKRILRVPKDELKDKRDSTGQTLTEESRLKHS
jgi:hypothetical protein